DRALDTFREDDDGRAGADRVERIGDEERVAAPATLVSAAQERGRIQVRGLQTAGKAQQRPAGARAAEAVLDRATRRHRDHARVGETKKLANDAQRLTARAEDGGYVARTDEAVQRARQLRRLALELLLRVVGIRAARDGERGQRGEREHADRQRDHRNDEARAQASPRGRGNLPGAHGSNRYPMPRTVLMVAAPPSFLRTCAMW